MPKLLLEVMFVSPFRVRSDAPMLSTEVDGASQLPASTSLVSPDRPVTDDEQWDDEALAASRSGRKSVQNHEVLDMKSLDSKRNEQDHIAEKLRVEETKAKLAAARVGMEREAVRLKEEQEKKEQDAKEKATARLGTAGGGGGTWVSSRVRDRGAAMPSLGARFGGASATQKLDVQNEELFPDLASAEKILEKKEKDQAPMFKVPKKTPVGGGASWASKAVQFSPTEVAATPFSPTEAAATPGTAPKVTVEPETPEPEPDQEKKPAASPSQTKLPTAGKVAPTKKKKRDVSSFKPSSQS